MVFDPLWVLLTLPGFIFALLAQIFVWLAYFKYSKITTQTNLTGIEVAKMFNDKEGYGVDIMVSKGKLNDYFNPLSHKVNISSENASSASVAAIAVVAHEFGHVQQKVDATLLFRLRSIIAPAVGIGANVGYILIFAGLALSVLNLAWIGLILFSLTTIFTFITLPIEIDASRRAMKLIKKYNLLPDNLGGAKQVLMAAALTYVAALFQSLLQLLYFALIISNRRRR
jgi:hypothetical protein